MHEFFDLSKKCYNYCCCPCNCHCKKNYSKCVCLTDKYSEFCEEDSIILKKNYEIIFKCRIHKVFLFIAKSY